MEDDWEQIADKVPNVPKLINKWDGEDEDDEVKESWEDEDEDSEKKDEEKKNDTPVKQKPKKTLAQKIAEKERLRQEELERKREEEQANWTPEQIAAEKLRLQQLQEEQDLKIALGTLGLTASGTGIDGMVPNTKEEFSEFSDAISKKLAHFRDHEEFPNFLDELVRNVCAATSSSTIRKVKTSLDNLYLEKQKMEKGDKPKKGKGAKGKAKLRMEGDDDYFTQANKNNFDDEYDDFM